MKQDSTIETLKAKIKSLEDEKNQHLSLFDKGDISLFKWNNDEEWTTAYASKNTISLLGYEPQEFLNKTITYAEVIHEDDFKRVYEEVIYALENEIDYYTHEEYRIITKEKEVKWVLDSTHMIRGEDGKVSHFLGTISDITQIKDYELNLEKIVERKRAAIIEQQALIYRQNRLLTIGNTIESISHQWRQPLNHIGANIAKLEMLNEEKLNNKEIEKIVLNTNSSLEYMSKTVSDFTNFFSPNQEKKLFSVQNALNAALRIIKPQFASKEIHLCTDIEDKEFSLYGYENELTQAILIILNNAQDAIALKKEKVTFDGEVKISLTSSAKNIILSIDNNGSPIDEKNIRKIFDPYFTTKFKTQGTGIGLYMCKMLVEKNMNGLINVYNFKDGVNFTILFSDEQNSR